MCALKLLIGPSKEEIWRELCRRVGGKLVQTNVWSGVVVQEKTWTILLDMAKLPPGPGKGTSHTRIRAFYRTTDGFKFTLYRSNWFEKLAKLFGMQAIMVGDPEFDREFIIQGNDKTKTRALFANSIIRDLVKLQPEIFFQISDDTSWLGVPWPDGIVELRFHVVGFINEVERLVSLIALFAETLHQLRLIGSATEYPLNLGL